MQVRAPEPGESRHVRELRRLGMEQLSRNDWSCHTRPVPRRRRPTPLLLARPTGGSIPRVLQRHRPEKARLSEPCLAAATSTRVSRRSRANVSELLRDAACQLEEGSVGGHVSLYSGPEPPSGGVSRPPFAVI